VVQLRYNYRVEPTPGQRIALARAFGCARVVFNDGLRARRDAHEAGLPCLSDGELSKQVITRAKATPEREWLGEVSAVVLQQALADLASFVVRAPDAPLTPAGSEVGIDLGLTHFAVLSDGTKVAAPRFLRQAARRLRRLQKALSRKTKGSRRRLKAVVNVARAHARVADTRRDFHHKLSTTIIRENQAMYVEDLAVAGLARTRLAKSVHDAGWARFTAMLEYKASRHGRTFGRVDRWFPSTRTCSTCGVIGEKLPLDVRSWTCLCGAVHDRDGNAAINILAAGRTDRPTPVEPTSDVPSGTQTATKREPTGSVAWATQTGIPTVHGGEDVNV
jgi:putative transposase